MSSRLYYQHTTASLAARCDFDHDAYYDDSGSSLSSSPKASPVADNPKYVSEEASKAFHRRQQRTRQAMMAENHRTVSDFAASSNKMNSSSPRSATSLFDNSNNNHVFASPRRKCYIPAPSPRKTTRSPSDLHRRVHQTERKNLDRNQFGWSSPYKKQTLACPTRNSNSEEKTDDEENKQNERFDAILQMALQSPTRDRVDLLFDELHNREKHNNHSTARSSSSSPSLLSLKEVERAIFQHLHLKPTVVLRAFEKTDEDKDGLISKHEFDVLLRMIAYFEKLHCVFTLMCGNQQQQLSLQQFLATSFVLKLQDPEQVWKEMDTSHTGYVCFDDFCNWMTGKEQPTQQDPV